eukprot:SAG11_NODE_3242_length_2588_cov_1.515468_3_plen_64_part_00
MMGARTTLVGGGGLKANRRCGRPTAGAVGAVAVGTWQLKLKDTGKKSDLLVFGFYKHRVPYRY